MENNRHFCFNCGKEIPNDVKYCPYCGTGQKKTTSKNVKRSKNIIVTSVILLILAAIGIGVWTWHAHTQTLRYQLEHNVWYYSNSKTKKSFDLKQDNPVFSFSLKFNPNGTAQVEDWTKKSYESKWYLHDNKIVLTDKKISGRH